MDSRLKKELLGYATVGFIGAGLDFGIFYLTLYLGAPLLVAQWLGASTGFLHNHLWHHFRIFKHNRSLGFTTSFSFIIVVLTVVVSGPLITLINNLLANVLLSKIIVSGFSAGVSFLIRRRWIFSNKILQ